MARDTEAPARLFPNFIVIGAMRAGTTTLYHHLNQHPEIGMSRMKETDYFIPKMNYPLGPDWYLSQFDHSRTIRGEVSPNYAMCHMWRGVPARIRAAVPDVKLIYLARDPVERLVSHYLHRWHFGETRVTPEALLSSEAGEKMLGTSSYAMQLRAYLAQFPEEQIMVLDFDELKDDAQAALDKVTDFLEVPRNVLRDAPATRNETDSTARLPGFAQRVWRSRNMRRFDRFISRGMRDTARRLLSVGPRRPDPEIGPDLRAEVAERLAGDAAAFRALTGQQFAGWSI